MQNPDSEGKKMDFFSAEVTEGVKAVALEHVVTTVSGAKL